MKGAAHQNICGDVNEDISVRCTLCHLARAYYKSWAALPQALGDENLLLMLDFRTPHSIVNITPAIKINHEVEAVDISISSSIFGRSAKLPTERRGD
jgi:hypothetical protein